MNSGLKLFLAGLIAAFCTACAVPSLAPAPAPDTPTPGADIVVQSAAPFELFIPADDGFIYQSGVGTRLRANIVTSAAGIDISSLFRIALAAQSNQLTGTLRFETIGINGKLTSSLIPLPSEISIESISSAMQAAAWDRIAWTSLETGL